MEIPRSSAAGEPARGSSDAGELAYRKIQSLLTGIVPMADDMPIMNERGDMLISEDMQPSSLSNIPPMQTEGDAAFVSGKSQAFTHTMMEDSLYGNAFNEQNDLPLERVHLYTMVAEQIKRTYESYTQRKSTSQGQNTKLANLARIERDVWALVGMLHPDGLLLDVDENACREHLDNVLASFTPNTTCEYVLETVLTEDPRLRKLFLILEWLQEAARDRVTQTAPVSQLPWTNTAKAIAKRSGNLDMLDTSGMSGGRRKGRSLEEGEIEPIDIDDEEEEGDKVSSLHPDAQITGWGQLLPLDGYDQGDEESFLKTVWQLIRSGQIDEARSLATERELHWLSSTLTGAMQSRYGSFVPAEGSIPRVISYGNCRKPIWTRSCWRYSERLSRHAINWSTNDENRSDNVAVSGMYGQSNSGKETSLSGVLEMSIYAALSNNASVLLRSPLVASWSDRLWVTVKMQLEYEILKIVHQHKLNLASFSKLLPGCDQQTLGAEKELTALMQANSPTGPVANAVGIEDESNSLGDLSYVLSTVPVPVHPTQPRATQAERLLLQLQVAMLRGKSAIEEHIVGTVLPVLYDKGSFDGREVILRLYAHLVLWLRTSSELKEIVSDETLHIAVEAYVDYLVGSKQWVAAPAYIKHLCVPRMINAYIRLYLAFTETVSYSAPSTAVTLSGRGGNLMALSNVSASETTPVNELGDYMNTAAEVRQALLSILEQVSKHTPQCASHVSEIFGTLSRASRVGIAEVTAPAIGADVFADLQRILPSINAFEMHNMENSRESRGPQSVPKAWIEPNQTAQLHSRMQALLWAFCHTRTSSKMSMSDVSPQADVSFNHFLAYTQVNHVIRDIAETIAIVPKSVSDASSEMSSNMLEALYTVLADYLSPKDLVIPTTEKADNLAGILSECFRVLPLDEADAVQGLSRRTSQLMWTAQTDQILFWDAFVRAMKSVRVWQKEVQSLKRSVDRMTGPMHIVKAQLGPALRSLHAAAGEALECLTAVMNCASVDGIYPSAGGIGELWKNAEDANVDMLDFMSREASQLLNKLRNQYGDVVIDGDDISAAAPSADASSNLFLQLHESASEMLQATHPSLGECITKNASLSSKLIDKIKGMHDSGDSAAYDGIACIELFAGRCLRLLRDLGSIRSTARRTTAFLLQSYADVRP